MSSLKGIQRLARQMASRALGAFERRLPEPCQRLNILGDHPLRRRAAVLLPAIVNLRRSFHQRFSSPILGKPSRYVEGQWVQVLDQESVRRTLDAKSRLRGLVFVHWQWAFCGGVYQVEKVMRRIIDDQGIFRPISGTVLLRGVDCGGPSGTEGCGRRCPLMFRDEWLKPLTGPVSVPPHSVGAGHFMWIRSLEEIRASLDRQGKRDGLLFMPEMAQWTGQRFRVARQTTRVYEHDGTKYAGYVPTRFPVYILEGLHCSGAVLGPQGPCDRRCPILWHPDWLKDDL